VPGEGLAGEAASADLALELARLPHPLAVEEERVLRLPLLVGVILDLLLVAQDVVGLGLLCGCVLRGHVLLVLLHVRLLMALLRQLRLVVHLLGRPLLHDHLLHRLHAHSGSCVAPCTTARARGLPVA